MGEYYYYYYYFHYKTEFISRYNIFIISLISCVIRLYFWAVIHVHRVTYQAFMVISALKIVLKSDWLRGVKYLALKARESFLIYWVKDLINLMDDDTRNARNSFSCIILAVFLVPFLTDAEYSAL